MATSANSLSHWKPVLSPGRCCAITSDDGSGLPSGWTSPLDLLLKRVPFFYSRLGFFLLKDNLRLNREPLKMWMSC